MLVTCMSPIPWKIFPISFDMPFLNLSYSGPLMRYRYYCAFSVSGQMSALSLPGGLDGGVLIFATWFSMRYFTWRRLDLVLYRCCVGIFWVSADF